MAKKEEVAAVVESFTLDAGKTLIAEAIKGLLAVDQVNELIKDLATRDEVKTLIDESQGTIIDYVNAVQPVAGTLLPLGNETSTQPPLDPAWLEGLLFHTATQEKKMVDGRPRMVATPIERDLEPEDVLDYRVTHSQVFIVTADGRKHTVER